MHLHKNTKVCLICSSLYLKNSENLCLDCVNIQEFDITTSYVRGHVVIYCFIRFIFKPKKKHKNQFTTGIFPITGIPCSNTPERLNKGWKYYTNKMRKK